MPNTCVLAACVNSHELALVIILIKMTFELVLTLSLALALSTFRCRRLPAFTVVCDFFLRYIVLSELAARFLALASDVAVSSRKALISLSERF